MNKIHMYLITAYDIDEIDTHLIQYYMLSREGNTRRAVKRAQLGIDRDDHYLTEFRVIGK